MRMRVERLAWTLGAAITVGAAIAGCWPFDFASDPALIGQVCEDGTLDCFSAGTGGTGGSGGTTTTTIDPKCVPSEAGDPVGDNCGVFVSSSLGSDAAEEGRGSKAKPYATIAGALGVAKGKPIYLCGETFSEAVQITEAATIYGALACAGGEWTYVAEKRTTITAAADAIPVRVGSKVTAEIHDVDVSATDATVPGGSSIAMLAESDADVMLTRCDLEAGNGAAGAEGEAFVSDAAAGLQGSDGAEACSAGTVVTPDPPFSECGDEDSIGGLGGNGTFISGGAGSPGLPMSAANAGAGQADDAGMCTPGTSGDDGAPGAPGVGAQTLGTLSAAGYAGVSGVPGEPGKTAQGGGGGGGAKGGGEVNPPKCGAVANMGFGGASGGSGGSGGCGGLGGNGGSAGGASIGIVSLGAQLAFLEVKITATGGGKGGDGGLGQLGGSGGPGGAGGTVPAGATALKPGCSGGPGGTGGTGGRGGGGRGGHSIGIAHTGDAPSTEGATITAGTPGDGGEGDGDMGSGAAGASAPVLGFDGG